MKVIRHVLTRRSQQSVTTSLATGDTLKQILSILRNSVSMSAVRDRQLSLRRRSSGFSSYFCFSSCFCFSCGSYFCYYSYSCYCSYYCFYSYQNNCRSTGLWLQQWGFSGLAKNVDQFCCFRSSNFVYKFVFFQKGIFLENFQRNLSY